MGSYCISSCSLLIFLLFFLSFDTKIAFYKRCLQQNVKMSPLEKMDITAKRNEVISIFNHSLVDYRF